MKLIKKKYIALSFSSICFILIGSIILFLNFNTINSFYDKERSFSNLLHIRGEMKYFRTANEDYRFEDDDDFSFGVEEEDEAFFILHLWESNDVFLYDVEGKNYETAKEVLFKKITKKGVMIDIWFDREINSRSYFEVKWFRNILQLIVDDELLISYDDVVEDQIEESLQGMWQGIIISSFGIILGLIVFTRRWDLRTE